MAAETAAIQRVGGAFRVLVGSRSFRRKRPTGAAMLLGVRLRTAAARIGSGVSPPPPC